MRRLRFLMLVINGAIVVACITLDLSGHSLAAWLYSCEWGIGVRTPAIIAYYLMFYIVPGLSFIALLTNKERPVEPKHRVRLHTDNPL